MKKCTQCGQILGDDKKFCFKCGGSNYEPVEEPGGSNFEPAEEAGDTNQQPPQPVAPPQQFYNTPQPAAPPPQQPVQAPQAYSSQPSYQPSYQQPAYQRPAKNETVSVGMNFLFIFLSFIPVINLIFAIVVAVGSGFKKSYQNLARAWLIMALIGIVLSIVFYFVFQSYINDFLDIIEEIYDEFLYMYG